MRPPRVLGHTRVCAGVSWPSCPLEMLGCSLRCSYRRAVLQ
jgi:hypothetical protein